MQILSLRASGFGFLRNKIWVLVLALISTSLGCQESLIFGIAPDSVMEAIKKDSKMILGSIESKKASEIELLGSGASFYTSFYAFKASNVMLAKELLYSSWKTETSFYKQEAGKLLLKKLTEYNDFNEIIIFAPEYLSLYQTDYNAWITYIKTLENTNNFNTLIKIINEFELIFPENIAPDDISLLTLYKCKALYNAKNPEWITFAKKGLFESMSTAYLSNLINFILEDPLRLTAFSAQEVIFIKIRSFITSRDYQKAMVLCDSQHLALFSPNVSKPLLSDAGKAYVYGGNPTNGKKHFESLKKQLIANPKKEYADLFYITYHYIGRCERELKNYSSSQLSFEKSLEYAPDLDQYRATLWYALDCSLFISYESYIALLTRYAPKMSDTLYFDDILNSLILELVTTKDFSVLENIYNSLKKAEIQDISTTTSRKFPILTRLSYILGRAIETNLYKSNVSYKQYYEYSLLHNASSLYYRFLASAHLNKEISLIPALDTNQHIIEKPIEKSQSNDDILLQGFITWGLSDYVFQYVNERRNTLSIESIRYFSQYLFDEKMYGDSIKTANILQFRNNHLLTQKDLELLYPRPYLNIISDSAKEFTIPEYILFGLIRTESTFVANIVSKAGAIGLSQLMPATANQMASQLKINNPDSTNPVTNARIGSYYLSYLLKQFNGNMLRALFAYNGGMGNVRNWIKVSKDLPEDLFLETIPFNETQNYGRKVLSAGAIYAFLYYNMKIESIAKAIIGN